MNAHRDINSDKVLSQLRIGILEVDKFRFGIEIGYLSEISVAKDLKSIISDRTDVIGALNLRGSLVPVLDVLQLCNIGRLDRPCGFVAVLCFADRLVGIAIDKMHHISDFSATEIQELYSSEAVAHPIVEKSLVADEYAANIIEVDRIFQLERMPTCAAKRTIQKVDEVTASGAYLTFRAGGATFSLEATDIIATVPRQHIEAGPVEGTKCLGIIKYLGNDIPTVDCADIVGLGDSLNTRNLEVVVVRLNHERAIGLAVDLIKRIEFLRKSDLCEAPENIKVSAPSVSSFFTDQDNDQTFIIDSEFLGSIEDVREISELSRSKQNSAGVFVSSDSSEIDQGISRYLIYNVSVQSTSLLTEIQSIIMMPEVVTPLNQEIKGFRGIFSYQGRVVLLVDLSEYLSFGQTEIRPECRVLIVKTTNAEVGFLVECVKGIQTATLIHDDNDRKFGPMIRSNLTSERKMLPVIDMIDLVGKVSQQLQEVS